MRVLLGKNWPFYTERMGKINPLLAIFPVYKSLNTCFLENSVVYQVLNIFVRFTKIGHREYEIIGDSTRA